MLPVFYPVSEAFCVIHKTDADFVWSISTAVLMATTNKGQKQITKARKSHANVTLVLTNVFAVAYIWNLTVLLTSVPSLNSADCKCKHHQTLHSPTTASETAAICAIVKDEQLYLEEWVLYNLGLGFQHIYLYDNSQQQTAASWRDQFIDTPEIRDGTTVVPFVDDSDTRQYAAYRDCMQRFGSKHT